MKKSFAISFLLAVVMAVALKGLAQDQDSRRMPTNKELVSKAQTVNIQSETIYMKAENLQSSLISQADFKAWDMQITSKPEQADLLIRVARIPFRNHFTYNVTDRRTATVVMAGEVDSLGGTVYGLIADEIVHKTKALRGDPLAKTTTTTQK
jgi:hypothetical protein